jgi:hypothetical protein
MIDTFDPNTWSLDSGHECRIYADDRAQQWAVVDEIDYQYLIQWKWSIKFSRHGRKFYLRRSTQSGSGELVRIRHTLFLHTAIMLRTGIEPPTPFHVLVDHRDGDGLNCRRENICWQTHSGNRRNTENYRNGPNGHKVDMFDINGVAS